MSETRDISGRGEAQMKDHQDNYKGTDKVLVDPTLSVDTDDKMVHKCGASSSYCPDFGQIPLNAMKALAMRFELGEKKHGRNNWRKGLGDKSYTISRLNHAIYHAYKLINKLEGTIPWDGDDDAAAIMWAGAFAVEAVNELQNNTKAPE